jgi:hypothetical protein
MADLEMPGSDDDLYLARGDEVAEYRPIFTCDVFNDVPIILPDGSTELRAVMIVQYPCSLRKGVRLIDELLLVKVKPYTRIKDWTGHLKYMPLPSLFPEAESEKARHYAAFLNEFSLATPAQLDAGNRVACLSLSGMNYFLQRWVANSSRVVVPTFEFNEQNIGVYEEAEVIEEWCTERAMHDVKPLDATAECMEWLSQPRHENGEARQKLLRDSQQRSVVRREARQHVRELNDQGQWARSWRATR